MKLAPKKSGNFICIMISVKKHQEVEALDKLSILSIDSWENLMNKNK